MTHKNCAPAPKTTKARSLNASELAKTTGGSKKIYVGGLGSGSGTTKSK